MGITILLAVPLSLAYVAIAHRSLSIAYNLCNVVFHLSCVDTL